MESLPDLILILLGSLALIFFTTFGILSLREGEIRAMRLSLALALVAPSPLFLLTALPSTAKLITLGVILFFLLVAALIFFLPLGRVERGRVMPSKRFDERDIMFARARLEPGSQEFEAYYAMRPENRAKDDRFRAYPGLLSPSARKANPRLFAAAQASFSLTEAVREEVDGPIAASQADQAPEHNTDFIKGLTLHLGAVSVGICELKPYHTYSHIGRGSGAYGAPIPLEHRFGIAFTVEMDHHMMSHAPEAPTVMESARQYVEGAKIALQIGYLIRSLGFPARGHIDGNYRVIAPLVARDAGLGEIGRIGILMTPKLGPRVRLGVVTTDLPLIPDPPFQDTSLLDYCSFCEKCAENCPSRSIPFGQRQEIDGSLRWRIDPDSCFRYWTAIGTDCGICMAVCPYSHPDHGVHNIVRWAIQRSGAARRASLWLDDFFYGRRHEPGPAPKWMPG